MTLPAPLGELESPGWLRDLLCADARAPVRAPAWVKATVRDLFRHRGYRPTGRGKPSSEYLAGAAGSLEATIVAAPGARAHVLSAAPVDPAVPYAWEARWRCAWSAA